MWRAVLLFVLLRWNLLFKERARLRLDLEDCRFLQNGLVQLTKLPHILGEAASATNISQLELSIVLDSNDHESTHSNRASLELPSFSSSNPCSTALCNTDWLRNDGGVAQTPEESCDSF